MPHALSSGLQFVVTYWGHILGINIETDMRRLLFEHIQKLSFRFFDNHKTGHLMTRMSTDLFDIGEVAHHGPEDLLVAALTFLGAFALMLGVSWPLALVAAGWGYGAWRLSQPLPPRQPVVTVRLVQPDADQALKWQPGMAQALFDRHLALTRAEPRADITVWSETAAPFLLDDRPDLLRRTPGELGQDVRPPGKVG